MVNEEKEKHGQSLICRCVCFSCMKDRKHSSYFLLSENKCERNGGLALRAHLHQEINVL